MRAAVLLVAVALAAGGWVAFRPPTCGGADAVACPAPGVDEGLGRTVERAEACKGAGYLCQGRAPFQVRRWPLARGFIRVRVPPPPVDDRAEARRLHDAAVAGVLQWSGHPFPLRVDRGRLPLRPWDVELYWVPLADFGGGPGGGGSYAGVTAITWSERGGKPDFSVSSISTILYDRDRAGAQVLAPSALVSQIAAHEMGHALGLQHSDRTTDVMTPAVGSLRGVSPRDLETVAALYRMPNGATVSGGTQ